VKYSIERALAINDPHGPVWMIGQVLIPNYYNYGAGAYNTTTDVYDSAIPMSVINDAIWAVDADTVQFNLTTAYPAFLYTMAYNVGSVVSPTWVGANYGFSESGTTIVNKLADDMCGTGPYTFVSWARDDKIIMKAFADYRDGAAPIENVVIQQVSEASTRILMLKSGEADCAAISRDLKTQVENVTGISVTQGLGTFNVDFLGLNQDLNLTALPNPERTSVPADFFADKYIRLAFAHAFDYATYIADGLLGTAIQPNGAIPMGMFAYSADVPVYDYDLEKAAYYLFMAKTPTTADGEDSELSTVLADMIARIDEL